MSRILQLFNCPIREIKEWLPAIKAQGFDYIQISPLQNNKVDHTDGWWLLYQPLGFEIGNKLGSKDDLYELCKEARKYAIGIIADAVINHVANKCDEEPLEPHPDVDRDLLENDGCFKRKAQITNWDDRGQVTNLCMGLPGLNPNSPIVQNKITNMLNNYIDLGVDGFRLDAAKSIALPSEGCSFYNNVLNSLNRELPLIYGEVLCPTPELIEGYSEYMKVLTNSDFHDKSRIVSFAESHDTYLSTDDLGYTREWPIEKVLYEYLRLAGEEGKSENILFCPRIFSDDWHAWKSSEVQRANQYVKERKIRRAA